MTTIRKVLIANRAEIAFRIIRTCKERGIKTVAVYSTPDACAPHVIAADESVHIGEASSVKSYLHMERIFDAAELTGADAIHPGYGFLSENAEFARECESRNIIFIGPSPEVIETMGDKTKARELMAQANVPFPPGTKSAMKDIKEAKSVALEIGYPILVKAAAGGGGKGMRIVYEASDFEKSVKTAKSEAKNSFGDDRVFIEKYFEKPRHIEFQIFADQFGNTVHMYERECSIQRRHQKVIEEAPSTVLNDELRQKMASAAVSAAKSCGYVGAGTVEFLVDKNGNFFFLEMNTRLQVEHPITELITGLDLVGLQIDVAEGKELPISQRDIQKTGHAIECRVYAEDPEDNFLPSTGYLKRHRLPAGPGVRVDAGIEEDMMVSVHYDPMISKLCVHAPSRQMAIAKMLRALDEYDIAGVRTTIPFCRYTLLHETFKEGNYNTHFVKEYFKPEELSKNDDTLIQALASAIIMMEEPGKQQKLLTNHTNSTESNWWEKRHFSR